MLYLSRFLFKTPLINNYGFYINIQMNRLVLNNNYLLVLGKISL